jgi:hypothetical protein
MTSYGFDLDGTVSKPQIARLANDLFNAGHDVYIITGGIAECYPWRMEDRIALLAVYGVKYTEIVRCIAPTWEVIAIIKGDECRKRGVMVMLDDMPVFLDGVRQESPETARLLVI